MEINSNSSSQYSYFKTKTETSKHLEFITHLDIEKDKNHIESKDDMYRRTNMKSTAYSEKSFIDNLSQEQLINRTQKIQEYLKNDYESFEEAKKEHNKRVREDSSYDPQLESKYFKDKRYYDEQDILLDGKIVHIDNSELNTNKFILDDEKLGIENQNSWTYQINIMKTESNKYEDAPEFEAFVNKWIAKGLSEDEALVRGYLYAQIGLLDYGKQKMISMDPLEYDDKNQDGFHLINNQSIKNAIIKTLDSLDNDEVDLLVGQLVGGNNQSELQNTGTESNMFQALLDKYAIKFNKEGGLSSLDDKKYSAYEGMEFTGDINITEKMSQLQKNFIYDSLIEYFNFHINQLSIIEKDYNEDMSKTKDTLNLLIKNFKENIKEDNENNRIFSEYMKNNKPIPY